MNKFSALLFALFLFQLLNCQDNLPTKCNDKSATARDRSYDACKNLPIDRSQDNGAYALDKYCCLWEMSKTSYFCGSISEEQYNHIKDYVKDKKRQPEYEGIKLKIKCGSSFNKVFLAGLFTLICLLF